MKKNKKISANGQLWKTILAAIGLAAIVFLSLLGESTGARASVSSVQDAKIDSTRIFRDSVKSLSDSLDEVKSQIIFEVDSYIKNVSKRSRMTGNTIVEECLEKDFDIPLLLAQAHQETRFAAGGGRNNVFGIHNKRYSHPDHSVSDYIKLMKSWYIIDRTPEELIASNFSMENNRKAKYATDPSYGKVIGKFRNRIIEETQINELTDKWNALKKEIEKFEKMIQLYELKKHNSHQEDSLKILT